jgi:hypothetical protein
MPDAYALSAVRIDKTADVIIDQITDQNLDPGVEELLEGGGGAIDGEHLSVSRQRPIITFTTTALETALGTCGLGGLVLDDGETTGLIEFHFRKRLMGSTFAGASSHLILTVKYGFMYITGVRATHPNAAQATFAVVAIYDGTNNPLTIVKAQTLPTLTSPADGIWTAGPVYINATKYDNDIRDFSLTPNINLGYVEGAGNVWPVSTYMQSRDAQMEFGMGDLALLDDATGLGSLGVIQSGVTRAYLRKKIAGAGVVADNVASHIQFGMAEGRIRATQAGGAHQGDVAMTVNCRATWDGTNDPIAIAVGETIDAA